MAESIQATRTRRVAPIFAVACLIVGLSQARPSAHDIPADVFIQMFVRPAGDRLTVLVRLPLAAMRDFNFPTRDGALLLDLRDPARLDAILHEAARLWIVPALGIDEDGVALSAPDVTSVRVSLPSDRSFTDFDKARAHLRGPPLPADTLMPWNQVLFDLEIAYPIGSEQARLAIDPRVARFGLRVVTVLRVLLPGHSERAFQFMGDPGRIVLDPRWHQAALRFVRLGFDHILDGIDHLLFLFCLVIPLRRFTSLVIVVTAFTVAHSITLFSAAFGYAPGALWFPPLVETLIAVSIVYTALENIVFAAGLHGSKVQGPRSRVLGPGSSVPGPGSSVPGSAGPEFSVPGAGFSVPGPASLGRRWLLAFAFGLVHGFGFSFALQETLQFAGRHLVASLVAFNLGVELGQLLVLLLLVPILALAFRFVVSERVGIIIASALVTHTAWHWMVERGSTLGEYAWSLPGPGALATVARLLMVVVAVIGVVWLARRRTR